MFFEIGKMTYEIETRVGRNKEFHWGLVQFETPIRPPSGNAV